MFNLVPREAKFFDLFSRLSDLIVQAAQEFRDLLGDLQHLEERTRKIKEIEHMADDVTHQTVDMLHRTFITPLDRSDIHQLVSRLDDIVDFIDAAAQRLALYEIKKSPPKASDLADICVKATDHLRHAVKGLEKLKDPQKIVYHCVEVNRLENDADLILRQATAQLFREEDDAKEIIKLKEVYELLETVTDRCEDVANIVEGIVVEYS